jgi:O-antigen/teichoic acid export membrane protein/ubiquinone/menaquinone biosynthesis C-methylase UbiE
MMQLATDQVLSRTVSASGARSREHAAPETAHRIVRNSTLNLTAQGLYAVFHLGVVFILARNLGKEVFGQYYLLYALILAVQVIVEAGVSTVLTCRLAQAPDRWHETVSAAAGIFSVIVLVSVGAFLVLGGARSWWQEQAMLLPFVAAGVACAAMQVQRFCTGVFHAVEEFGQENAAKIVQGALFAVLVIAGVGFGSLELVGVLVLFALSQCVAAGYLLVALQRRWHCLHCRLTLAQAKDWLAEAVPLGLGDVIRGLTWQLDTILLGILQPAAVVAIYSVAYRPLGPLNWLPRAVLTAAFPSFARMADGDPASLDRASAVSLRLLWVISLPIAISICVCAEPIIILLAGEQYLDAVEPMRILIWITTLSYLSFQFRFLFAALGRQRAYIVLAVSVLAVEAVVQLLLIPRWSYFGACAGTMLGEALFTTAGLLYCRRLGVGRIGAKAMAAAALAGVVMTGLLWQARGLSLPLLVVVVLLSTGVYGALCVGLGALRTDEIRRFRSILTGLVPPPLGRRAATGLTRRDSMSHANVRLRYQDEEVVKCYDDVRFRRPIGWTIDALEKRAIRKMLAAALVELPVPEVLDVPCGTGRITELILGHGLTVTGGDISLPMIDAAQAKLAHYGNRVSFRHLDLEERDLPDQSFDLVTCIRMFNHIGAAEQERILRELARVTRNFAIVNLSFSSALYRFTPYRKRALGMPMPRVLPSWLGLQQRMSAAGFEIFNVAYELRFLSEVVVVLLRRR